jgi:hypothetical protein
MCSGEIRNCSEGDPAIPKTGSVPERVREEEESDVAGDHGRRQQTLAQCRFGDHFVVRGVDNASVSGEEAQKDDTAPTMPTEGDTAVC